MTGIVIPSGCEESFPCIFISAAERKIMIHCVVDASPQETQNSHFLLQYVQDSFMARCGDPEFLALARLSPNKPFKLTIERKLLGGG